MSLTKSLRKKYKQELNDLCKTLQQRSQVITDPLGMFCLSKPFQ